MMSKSNRFLLFLILGLAVSTYLLLVKSRLLKLERDKYRTNTEALLTSIEKLQIDSFTTAASIKSLELSVNEYEKFRAEDASVIKKMGIRIKDLEAAARHDLIIQGPVEATLRDSVVMRDTIMVVKAVEMITPHIQLKGIIEDNYLKGSIYLPVHIHQAIWVEYKHRFLWWKWKIKAIRQTISSSNPYVGINYTEYIKLK